ncbi:Protocadherin beta-14 [Camelus dromedarius]|uniref:Protocadherin beta-14 n=1 Tax=Camelus dromedarius TaxID=9838 RepID=A0A5N4EBJ4_CAMDR|nr:Protocadherin beta-14 [Camelus dromedarius]
MSGASAELGPYSVVEETERGSLCSLERPDNFPGEAKSIAAQGATMFRTINQPNSHFRVLTRNRNDGRKYPELVLDKELVGGRARNSLTLTALDGGLRLGMGLSRLKTQHNITVLVSDVNDNAPAFTQASYTLRVRENKQPRPATSAPSAPQNRRRRQRPGHLLAAAPADPPCPGLPRVHNADNGHLFARVPRGRRRPRLAAAERRRWCAALVLRTAQNTSAALHRAVPGGRAVPGTKVVGGRDAGQNAWLPYQLLKATEPGCSGVAHNGEKTPTHERAPQTELRTMPTQPPGGLSGPDKLTTHLRRQNSSEPSRPSNQHTHLQGGHRASHFEYPDTVASPNGQQRKDGRCRASRQTVAKGTSSSDDRPTTIKDGSKGVVSRVVASDWSGRSSQPPAVSSPEETEAGFLRLSTVRYMVVALASSVVDLIILMMVFSARSASVTAAASDGHARSQAPPLTGRRRRAWGGQVARHSVNGDRELVARGARVVCDDNKTTLAPDSSRLGIAPNEKLDREKLVWAHRALEKQAEYNITITTNITVWCPTSRQRPLHPGLLHPAGPQENNSPALHIGTVSATDTDAGANAQVTYSLLPPADPTCPCLPRVHQRRQGHLFPAVLDYEALRAFELRVGGPPTALAAASSQALVRVLVEDDNDNAPFVLVPAAETPGALPRAAAQGGRAGYMVWTKVGGGWKGDAGRNAWLAKAFYGPRRVHATNLVTRLAGSAALGSSSVQGAEVFLQRGTARRARCRFRLAAQRRRAAVGGAHAELRRRAGPRIARDRRANRWPLSALMDTREARGQLGDLALARPSVSVALTVPMCRAGRCCSRGPAGGGVVVDVGHQHCYVVLRFQPGSPHVCDSDGDVVLCLAFSLFPVQFLICEQIPSLRIQEQVLFVIIRDHPGSSCNQLPVP